MVISEDNVPSCSLTDDIQNLFMRKTFFKLICMFYPKANVVIAVSETIKHDLVKKFRVPEEKIVVNKNWVLNHTTHKNVPEHFDLIYVGRVHRVKNLSLFVEIIHEVRKVIPSLSCCIVGGGDDTDNILRLIEHYALDSTLSLVGFQRDISKYLSASRIFCLTSHSEGLPISALEAMAHGLPVVATAYLGAKELVQDGKTGYVCANKKDYVDRVIGLLVNEKERVKMGEQAREYVRTYHGEDNLKRFVMLLLEE